MPTVRNLANRWVTRKVAARRPLVQRLAPDTAAEVLSPTETRARFEPYRYNPVAYVKDILGWEPWGGVDGATGQREILEEYAFVLRQLHERRDYDRGLLTEDGLTVWKPGTVIRNRFRIEAGHTVGKTKMGSGLVNHYIDCFAPSIIYTYAPTWDQIHDLLWKEIKADRRDKGLPGRILDVGIKVADAHFATGRAANKSSGTGSEKVQGQHEEYLLFMFDEAEGIEDFVFEATESMMGGGIAIQFYFANPRTRASKFYRLRTHFAMRNYRLSCIDHPNVRAGKELVPKAVRREYVESMISEHCEVVETEDPDNHVFALPFPANLGETVLPQGTLLKPDNEFLFRVLGIAPANSTADTFLSFGRYEASQKRPVSNDRPHMAWFGVDCAGYGADLGTLYIRHAGRVWREAQLSKADGSQDPFDYWQAVRKAALRLAAQGVTTLRIRIDAGGGFGNGLYDRLKRDAELIEAFTADRNDHGETYGHTPERFRIHRVHFGAPPKNADKYADLSTQMYAEACEAVSYLTLVKPPALLEEDLCERKYTWVTLRGVEVRRMEDKVTSYRKRKGHSPDDGDGFVLAVCEDHLFKGKELELW